MSVDGLALSVLGHACILVMVWSVVLHIGLAGNWPAGRIALVLSIVSFGLGTGYGLLMSQPVWGATVGSLLLAAGTFAVLRHPGAARTLAVMLSLREPTPMGDPDSRRPRER